ncbi:hypothetical protein [Nisaea denitrificans]|uniref:hypothetical protein n=1 Tax=Nisaea denitrificans TaxID=390877 RepID=UPI001969E738
MSRILGVKEKTAWIFGHAGREGSAKSSKSGTKTVATTTWNPIAVIEQMLGVLCCALGRQLRRMPEWGLNRPYG